MRSLATCTPAASRSSTPAMLASGSASPAATTCASNAPFLGLLGTVIGIVRAFHELNGAAGRVTSGLMAEVGEALVATAVGIMVALPAIAAYNYFQRIIKARIARADAFGKEVLALFHSEPPAVAPVVIPTHKVEPVLIGRRVA